MNGRRQRDRVWFGVAGLSEEQTIVLCQVCKIILKQKVALQTFSSSWNKSIKWNSFKVCFMKSSSTTFPELLLTISMSCLIFQQLVIWHNTTQVEGYEGLTGISELVRHSVLLWSGEASFLSRRSKWLISSKNPEATLILWKHISYNYIKLEKSAWWRALLSQYIHCKSFSSPTNQ